MVRFLRFSASVRDLRVLHRFNLVNHVRTSCYVSLPLLTSRAQPWHGRSMEDYSKPCDWETAFAEANERYPTQLQ